jgi:hypothetical protein
VGLRHLIEDAGSGCGWSDAIDGYVFVRCFFAERFSKRNDPRLCCTVGGGVCVSFFAGYGSDVDDSSVVLSQHVRHDGAAAEVDSDKVDVDDFFPGVDGVFPGLVIRAGNSGVGDENVDFAVLFYG